MLIFAQNRSWLAQFVFLLIHKIMLIKSLKLREIFSGKFGYSEINVIVLPSKLCTLQGKTLTLYSWILTADVDFVAPNTIKKPASSTVTA